MVKYLAFSSNLNDVKHFQTCKPHWIWWR